MCRKNGNRSAKLYKIRRFLRKVSCHEILECTMCNGERGRGEKRRTLNEHHEGTIGWEGGRQIGLDEVEHTSLGSLSYR